MVRGLKDDARLRFIVRHGVVPWGIVVGTLTGVGGALALRDGAVSNSAMSMMTAIWFGALCFAIWCPLAGWVVGAIRWELRRLDETDKASARRHER